MSSRRGAPLRQVGPRSNAPSNVTAACNINGRNVDAVGAGSKHLWRSAARRQAHRLAGWAVRLRLAVRVRPIVFNVVGSSSQHVWSRQALPQLAMWMS